MAFEYQITGTTKALWRMDQVSSTRVYDATSNDFDLYTFNTFAQGDYNIDGFFNKQVTVLSLQSNVYRLYIPYYNPQIELIGPTTISMWAQIPSPIDYSIVPYFIKAYNYIELGYHDQIGTTCNIYTYLGDSDPQYCSFTAQISVFNNTKTDVYYGQINISDSPWFQPDIYYNIILVHSGAYEGARIKLYIDGELVGTAYASKLAHSYGNPSEPFWAFPDLGLSNRQSMNISECIVDGAAWSHDFCVAYGSQRSNKYNFTISPGI